MKETARTDDYEVFSEKERELMKMSQFKVDSDYNIEDYDDLIHPDKYHGETKLG